jgi:hypothetical protein
MDDHRLTSWIDWYRFARSKLEYNHGQAVVYANVRAVADLNRRGRARPWAA